MSTVICEWRKPDRAPKYDYGFGLPSWAGKAEADLTEEDRLSILTFAESEGFLKGNNSVSSSEPVEEYAAQPFHPDFLNGEPFKAWEKAVKDGRARRLREAWLFENVFRGLPGDGITHLREYMEDVGFSGEYEIVSAPSGTAIKKDWDLSNPYQEDLGAGEDGEVCHGFCFVPLPSGKFFRFSYAQW